MQEEKRLSDHIIDAGDDFQLDALDDVNERIASGEFEGKSDDEIRSIIIDEAIQAEQEEDFAEEMERLDRLEEQEEDARDFHIPVEEDEEDDDGSVVEDDEEDDE